MPTPERAHTGPIDRVRCESPTGDPCDHGDAPGTVARRDRPDPGSRARTPVRVQGRTLCIGDTCVEAYSAHIDDVLVAFIELIRSVRAGSGPVRMAFRRHDLDEICAHFGFPGERVVEHLGDLVGASEVSAFVMGRLYDGGAALLDSGVID